MLFEIVGPPEYKSSSVYDLIFYLNPNYRVVVIITYKCARKKRELNKPLNIGCLGIDLVRIDRY